MDDAKGLARQRTSARMLGTVTGARDKHHCRYAPRGRYEALTRFAALQFAMPDASGSPHTSIRSGRPCRCAMAENVSLHARHFERVLPVIVHNGINAGRLDDFSGLVRIFSHVISLLK